MTNHAVPSSIRGERALADGDIDRLGFKEVATRIASSLVDHASDDGIVIGIDGRWGSGKSSLLYLILAELDKLAEHARPTIVPYRPWLIGNRDALLTALFNQLAEAAAKVSLASGNATADTIRKAKIAAERVRKFAQSISKAGELLQAVPGSATAGIVGKGLSALGGATSKGESPDLATQKRKLTESLRDLSHRFIVTVDDVDRLEPKEVVEVLRVIRSVADFPNIIYLLCYDSDILAESVRRGADVPDGAAYLEKIVQLTVMVPQPEPFQLRQWFGDEIIRMTGSLSEDVQSRLRAVVDQEGGKRLATPRAVVRTLDSFRFFWPALKHERIDLPDLVWLLLIKDGAPKLYRWIEAYLANAAIIATGIGSVSDIGKARELEDLRRLIGPGHFDDLGYRHFLIEQLPGVELDYTHDGDGLKLYHPVNERHRDAAIAARRLASPDHYRLYLALIGPTHAITQAQSDDLLDAAQVSPAAVGDALAMLAQQPISPEMSKIDLFLERLSDSRLDSFTPDQAANLLIALSERMDAFDLPASDHAFMLFTTWDRAEKLVRPLLKHVQAAARQPIIDRMFKEGAALGWLSNLLRHETFAHGRFGEQRKPEQEWILSEAEYDHVAKIMISRYKAQSLADLLSRTRPLNMLFAWLQAGDADGPKQLLQSSIETDTGLIRILEAFITTMNSSDRGKYELISRENVGHFLAYDEAISRAESINGKEFSIEDQVRLKRVQAALNNSRGRLFGDGK